MSSLIEFVKKPIVVCFLLILMIMILMGGRHRGTGYFNWESELWADQAGYYVYLPSLFIYQFDINDFPKDVDKKTGDGFKLDFESGKVITRYTCGVAILQAPFFLLIHFLAGAFYMPLDGFSGIYHHVPNLAALFYSFLGLFFLWKFLLFYFKKKTVLFTIIALFFGTNLYYYAIDNTGMSHIYSFVLFAIIAWITKKLRSRLIVHSNLFFVGWSFIFALIVLIRPTNIFIFPFLFCLDCNSWKDFILRLKSFFRLKHILFLIAGFSVVFLPQFLYWKYVSGDYIYYSYEGYGFSNWKSPKLLELWFSPNNGLFLYSPLYIVAIFGMMMMILKKMINGWLTLLTFFAITYLFASWYLFSYGCGYGSRNYVEYLVLFAIPTGYFFSWLGTLSKTRKYIISVVVALLVVFNLNLIYSYNRCFQGGDWDFREYVSYFIRLSRYHESLSMEDRKSLSPEDEFSKAIYIPGSKVFFLKFKKAIVRSKVLVETEDSDALVVLSVENPDSIVYWNAFRLGDQVSKNRLFKKQTVEGEFWLPVPISVNSTIATYIWNKNKESISVIDLEIFLE